MPSAASIAIADSVPVTRNYAPFMITGLQASHIDSATAATPQGQSSFSFKLRQATATLARQFDLNFALPVEYTDSTTGNVLTKDCFRFQGRWLVPPSAVLLQRNNFEALVRNLIANTVVRGYVISGDAEY